MSYPRISIPLDIEGVNVLRVDVKQMGDIHITIESRLSYGSWQHCGQKVTKLHD